jgi:4-amino-4-deoxy-L-arabinose transferase-like glycosyltransferase
MSKFGPWLLLLLVMGFVVAVRWRLLEIPLERDEGDFAYIGQLMLRGIPPYQQAYDMQFPGVSAMYAIFMAIFGQTATGIHLGLLIVNVTTILLVFLLGRQIFDPSVGVVAAASYAVLSISPWVLGFAAHATSFVNLFSVSACLLLWRATESERLPLLLLSGLLFGIAVLMKQHAVFFVLFGFVSLGAGEWRLKPKDWRRSFLRMLVFGCGSALPLALTCLALYIVGVLHNFWTWCFIYGREYMGQVPATQGLDLFRDSVAVVMGKTCLLWAWAAVGLAVISVRRRWRARSTLFIILLLVASILSMSTGFRFRNQYFVVTFPFVSILIGLGYRSVRAAFQASELPAWLRKAVPVSLLAATFGYVLYVQRYLLFMAPPDRLSRLLYYPNPFADSQAIARYINGHSTTNACIAILGSEAQIYFYAQRQSATGYLYTYNMVARHPHSLHTQRQMIKEIEMAEPEYLIFVNIDLSWLIWENAETTILHWSEQYAEKNYDLIGVVDLVSVDHTEFRWQTEAKHYRPRSPYFVLVFHRKVA